MEMRKEPAKCCNELRHLQIEIYTIKKSRKYDLFIILGAYLLGVATQIVLSMFF